MTTQHGKMYFITTDAKSKYNTTQNKLINESNDKKNHIISLTKSISYIIVTITNIININDETHTINDKTVNFITLFNNSLFFLLLLLLFAFFFSECHLSSIVVVLAVTLSL